MSSFIRKNKTRGRGRTESVGDGTWQHGRSGGQGRLPEEATFEQRPEGSEQIAIVAAGSPDSMGKKNDCKPTGGLWRVLKLPQFHSQLQVWGGRWMSQLRRANCSWS